MTEQTTEDALARLCQRQEDVIQELRRERSDLFRLLEFQEAVIKALQDAIKTKK